MTGMALAVKLIAEPNTIMIGSQRLEVSTEDSDVDLCVYSKEVDDIAFDMFEIVQRQDYYGSLLLEHSIMFKYDGLDIFVFDSLEKLKIVELVMSIMEDYPKFVIRIKWVRVKIFRYLLEKYRFLDKE